MLKVPIEQARQGMVLARSIPNPQMVGASLLKTGYTLESEDIVRLRTLRVFGIWVMYPSLDFLDGMIDPEITQKQQELYCSLKEQFTKTQEQTQAKVDYSLYMQQIGSLATRLLSQKGQTAVFIDDLLGEANDVFLHGTTVAYLALLMGMRLEQYLIRERPLVSTHTATDLTNLGVGSLLHDIGKLELPEELRDFKLTAQDQGEPLWQSHADLGFKMLQGNIDPSAAQIALNHHQHFDGSGFPARKTETPSDKPPIALKGQKIHIFCRIATIADRFDGFRYLPDGTIAPVVVALKRMQNPGYAKWFDPEIYSVFLETIPPFSLGENVTLNNGQDVVIKELNEKEPCRPIVHPVDLSHAQNPTNPIEEDAQDINLSNRPDLHVATVGGFDVTPFLY